MPAQALELGDANLRSALGERLLVEIPITSEVPLPRGCVDARVGKIGGTLRSAGQRQRPGGIVISTPRIVSEPMLAVSVTIACPGQPRLTRDYTLFLDPTARGASRNPSVLAATRRVRPALARRPAVLVEPGSVTTLRRYRVQAGDTVSAIAASLTPQGQTYWPVVDRIVAANPAAFVDGDPDRLLAGSVLLLPGVTAPAPPPPTAAPSPAADAGARSAAAGATPAGTANGGERPAATAIARGPGSNAAATPAGRSTADRLLNVLSAPDTPAASPASPFADAAPVAPAGAGKAGVAATDAAPATASRPSWTGRLIGLAAGMLIALIAFAAWQRATRPAARRTSHRELDPVNAPVPARVPAVGKRSTNRVAAPEPLDTLPALTSDLFEPPEDLVATRTFEAPGRRTPQASMSPRTGDEDIRVSALESSDSTDYLRELDDATRELLEADYEAELTRTQRLEQAAVDSALLGDTESAHDVTIEMRGYDRSTDTVSMPVDDDAGFAQATEARYVDETEAPGGTEEMPGLDLDLELPGTSTILEMSGEALSEALGEDLEVEADAPPRKKRA